MCYTNYKTADVSVPPQGGGAMRTYEALSLMIAFGILVATVILATK